MNGRQVDCGDSQSALPLAITSANLLPVQIHCWPPFEHAQTHVAEEADGRMKKMMMKMTYWAMVEGENETESLKMIPKIKDHS